MEDTCGINVYFMVNGQTGAVAAIGRGEMKGRKTLFAPGQDASTMGETTIQTDFLPVIQNSENIYKVVSKEEAFETIEKAILLFREQGKTGERFSQTIARLGFDYIEKELLEGDIMSRKQQILDAELHLTGGATC